MNNPQLILPTPKYQASFLAAVKEYQAEGLRYYTQLSSEELEDNFTSYIRQLEAESAGKNLPEGYVAHTTFWLVEGNEYIGRVDIRHDLNDFLRREGGHLGYDIRPSKRGQGYGKLILKLGLEKAKEMGLPNILITCDIDNIPSKKVIEANGGQLERVEPVAAGGPDKALYWIKTI